MLSAAPGGVLECPEPQSAAARNSERTGSRAGQRLHPQNFQYASERHPVPSGLYAGHPGCGAIREDRGIIICMIRLSGIPQRQREPIQEFRKFTALILPSYCTREMPCADMAGLQGGQSRAQCLRCSAPLYQL